MNEKSDSPMRLTRVSYMVDVEKQEFYTFHNNKWNKISALIVKKGNTITISL